MERSKMKKEAIRRLKKLGLHPNVWKEMEKDNLLYYSERSSLGGILYWMNNVPEWADMIRKIEREHGILVYHVTHEHAPFGECLSCLYVSPYEEDWELDEEGLSNDDPEYGKILHAYVINLSSPDWSEYGTIGVREVAGGLIRTA